MPSKASHGTLASTLRDKMRKFLNLYNRPILWMATILHMFWGSMLIVYPDTVKLTTGLAPFSFAPTAWGLAMVMSSTLAAIALVYEAQGKRVNAWTFWCFLPQQAFLMVSAFSVIYFVSIGHYASGTMLPRLFIFTDQFPKIILAILHPLGVLRMHMGILPKRAFGDNYDD